MSDIKECEKAEWIDNDFICNITGKVCIYSLPNKFECHSVYDKYQSQLKRRFEND